MDGKEREGEGWKAGGENGREGRRCKGEMERMEVMSDLRRRRLIIKYYITTLLIQLQRLT